MLDSIQDRNRKKKHEKSVFYRKGYQWKIFEDPDPGANPDLDPDSKRWI
jgi:hypothetical protein